QLLFELLDLLACAQQHAALHVEFFARDQVEVAQAGLQHAAERRGEVFARFAQARRYEGGKASCECVDGLGLDHAFTAARTDSVGWNRGSFPDARKRHALPWGRPAAKASALPPVGASLQRRS